MKKLGVFIPILLTIVLALSVIPNAFAGTWIYYDDGFSGQFGFLGESFVAVKFSLPSGWSNAKILTARYYATGSPGPLNFRAHVFDSDGVTPLLPSPILIVPLFSGWIDVDLSSYDIFVTRDFYVAMEQLPPPPVPAVGIESIDPISQRSFYGEPGSWILRDDFDMLIRVEVDRINLVGGVVSPINKLAIIAPYAALAGLVATVSTAYIIKKRKD